MRPSLIVLLLIGASPAALAAQSAPPPAPASQARGAVPPAGDEGDEEEEQQITVTGTPRPLPGAVIGDIPPELQLGPADIRSYGVSTVTDLLAELAPEIGSGQGRGGEQPVVLLNGHRISGLRELRDVPTEAILRVDILPEEVALRYGYSATQKVVNILLRRRFRAVTLEATAGTATAGGAQSARGEATLLHIRGDTRLNLSAQYQRSAALRESQRDIVPTSPERPFDFAGNVTGLGGPGSEIDPALSALAGETVTIAGVPGPDPSLADFVGTANVENRSDLSRFRTLRPLGDQLQLNAVWARPLSRHVSATFNASFESTGSRSLNGVPEAALVLPAGNPFSPFATDVALDRYVEGLLLTQNVGTQTAHAGATIQGDIERWHWTLTGNYDHVVSRTRTVRGIDLSGFQDSLDAGDPGVDPFGPLRAGFLGPLLIDRARSVSDTGNVQLVTNGNLLDLPGGPLSTTVKLAASTLGFDTSSIRAGVVRSADLSRNDASAQVSVDVPLTSRRRHFLEAIGDLSANFNFSADRISDFGTVTDLGYGLTWKPVSRVTLLWSMSREEGAPSVQQLGNPQVLTPQVPVFDFTTGRTVFVTRLDGGNPGLSADRRNVFKLGLNASILDRPRLNITANYVRTRTDNAIANLPAATAAIEAAFPDRFMRGDDGELDEIDNRPVNFARQRRDQLRWGFNLSVPLRASAAERARLIQTFRSAFAGRMRGRPGGPESRAGGEGAPPPAPGTGPAASPGGDNAAPGQETQPVGGRGGGFAGRGGGFGGRGGGFGGRGGGFGGREGIGAGRLQFAVYHSWIFRNDILIRPGLPVLDLLNGDALGSTGGQPRHQIQAQAGYSKGAYGARLSLDWQSGTTVNAGPGNPNGDLRFSDLATANLRLFVDMSQIGSLGTHSWARGLRLSLSVNNLFDGHQRVRDANGNTPLSFQPDYLDPVGREIRFTVRKLFF